MMLVLKLNLLIEERVMQLKQLLIIYLQKKNLIGSLKDQFKICVEMDLNGKRIYASLKKLIR